jgi:VanZ family protein
MDKLFHFGNYAVLGFLASISFPKHHYWWKLCLPLVVFGFLIECLQGLSGYRNFSWLDLLANTSGLITAGLVTKAKP